MENRTRMPILVRADFPGRENARPSRSLPLEAELAPGARALLVRFAAEQPDRPSRVASQVEALYGSRTSRHDDATRYAWPFGGGEPRRMTQGVGGVETHRGRTHYAFDFTMPEGTPVLAARAGVVVLVKDGFVRGGLDLELEEKANTVVVLHGDGSFASYGHLRRGIPVREGQSVAVGQRLGRSGATGYAAGPHLHFQVGMVLGGDDERVTVPIRFDDGSAAGVVPAEGDWCGPGHEVARDSGR
jgi:murein DD-endopeptidase MepM/ murein hydrolase activator NlpD